MFLLLPAIVISFEVLVEFNNDNDCSWILSTIFDQPLVRFDHNCEVQFDTVSRSAGIFDGANNDDDDDGVSDPGINCTSADFDVDVDNNVFDVDAASTSTSPAAAAAAANAYVTESYLPDGIITVSCSVSVMTTKKAIIITDDDNIDGEHD